MGGCISSPLKRHLKRPKRQPSVASSSKGTVRCDTYTRPTNVLNKHSERNLFDRYELGKELGRGEFGITHRCIDRRTGEILACKTISKSKLKTEIDVEDVRREVEIMRHLPAHPNIVRFREAFEDKEAVHLVMELCEGGELFDRIVAKGHYTERAAANVTKIIIEIVQVCHEHGVIHRDLKPENFLFADANDGSDIKAIDFGLSVFFQPGQRFNEIVGSPYYMAPEVLRRNYGHEVDVWSAGVILYILLCGVPPFWAENEEGIAHAIVKSALDLEKDPWPKVSQEAKDLVKGMLDPNPYSRLTVEEVLDHSWIRNANLSPTIPLGENVRARIKQFFLMNKFKKRVLSVVADNLPDDQIDVIKEMFYQMDTDKNGDISFDELKHGLQKIGHAVPDPDVRMLLDAADLDGNGVLNCNEFVTMSVHLKKLSSDDEHLRQAFNHFDNNKNGYIELEELREALMDENLGPNNEQLVREIINDIDLDKVKDGRISYEEFKTMMKAGMNWKMASRQYSRAMLKALSLKMFKDKSMKKMRGLPFL